jgi:tetratricopeptide (TPR) repeat protein
MITRRIYQIVAILLFLIIVVDVAGQKKSPYFQIPGRIKMDKGEPTGAVVTVLNLETNQIFKTVPVNSSGKFDLELNYQTDYQLSISKEGYYNKDILISTLIPKNIWEKDSVFPPYVIVVTLYEKVPDVKMSFEGKSIGKISYSPDGNLDNFDADVYIDDKDIKNEIDLARANMGNGDFDSKLAEALEFEKSGDLNGALLAYTAASKMRPSDKFVKEKIKELGADLKDVQSEAKKQAEFDRLIALGDANVNQIKYTQALINYRQALNVKPNNPVALEKISATEGLIAKLEADKAKFDADFNRLLASGDENVKVEKYAEGIIDYKGALTLKPSDPTATAKLASAEQLLARVNANRAKLEAEFARLLASGDENINAEKYAEAVTDFKGALNLKPSDSEATAKLASAEQLLAKANANKAKLEAEFSRMLASGDENVNIQKYNEAISDYKGALNLKPNDPTATTKLASTEQLLAKSNADKAKLEAEFNRLLASGDDNVKLEKYPEAITDFKGALALKPNDPSATLKLTSAEQLLAKINADKEKLEADFNRLLASGDENVKVQKYSDAITDFKGALELKPNDLAAKTKLTSAEQLLAKANAKMAKLEADFTALLASGDEKLKVEKYAEAITDYKGALTLKPNDPTASAKLTSAEQLLAKINADKEKLEADFSRLIASGDENVKVQKYFEAINDFKGALELKPKDIGAKAKLTSAEQLLARENAKKANLEAEFSRLLASGDNNVKVEKYAEAITDFKGAVALKPNDPTATAKLTSAEQLFAKITADKEKLEADFNRLIASGDENVKVQKYSEAINDFKGALELKPKDIAAKSKLTSAEQLLARENAKKANLEAEFNRLLASGDNYVKVEKYVEAIADFKGALDLKPADPTATAKIASAEQLMAKANSDKAKLEADFNRLLASGDENVKVQKYPEAIADFKGALNLKPKDPMATAKLITVEQILAKNNADKAKLEADFNRLLASGDENMKVQKYPEAITDFKGALELKPKDPTATVKLASAEQLLAKANADKAKLEADFNRLLASGDENVKVQKYPEAIADFKSALNLKPKDSAATAKLVAAEQLMAKANADKAKQEADFNRLLASGDENMKVQKYPEAITDFKGALELKPKDPTATAKLVAAEQLLAKANADKAKLEADFNRLLASGDENVKVQKFPEAITDFKSALNLKQKDPTATAKLVAAEQLMAKANTDKAKLEADFNRLLTSGDENVKVKKYPEAITDFKGALELKPKDPVATAKLASSEQLLAKANEDKKRIELEKLALAEKESRYKASVEKADQQFNAKLYSEAKSEYLAAIAVDGMATYPKERVILIDKLIKDQETAAALARQQEEAKQKSYDDAVKLGDTNFESKKWQESLTAYYTASKIKPEQVYPKTRIEEVKKIIDSETALNKAYQDALLKGSNLFDSKKYNESLSAYREAQKLKPEEELPPRKISEIQLIIDDLAAKQLAAQKLEEANKLSSQEVNYQNSIKSGDENFQKTQWSVARFYYTEALKFKPDDKYALEKVNACDNMTSANITGAKIQEYNTTIQKGDQSFEAKNYSSARFYYRNALEILPWDNYPQKKLKEIDDAFAKNLSDADQQLFAENLKKADDAFEKREYPVARFYYNKANEINPDQYVSAKLKEIESIVSGKETGKVEAEYNDFIKKADEAYQQKSNSVARFYYQKAALLKPNENYPKEQLGKINAGQ